MDGPPNLTTKRLMLRPFEPADAGEVQRLAGDYEVAAGTLSLPHPYEDGMAEEWIATHAAKLAEGVRATFAVVERATDDLVGAIGLMLSPAHERAELGYWIGRPYWGRGYATEASRKVLCYAFEQLGLRRVTARHFTRNPASGRVLEKIGMRHEGTARAHLKRWEKFEDTMLYGILREEFEMCAGGDFVDGEGMGRIERIWIKPPRRAPMRPVESARLVAGRGLDGNANQGGKRQVTLVDKAAWERATARLGTDVDPSARRANLLLIDVDLKESTDRILKVGECRIHLHGETRPCGRMDEACEGLRGVLEADWGGGAYGMVLDDGLIRVGDPATWV